MMRNEIELLDENYENVSLEKKSRQIKTRKTSFSGISENFKKFRISLLNKMLEREKDKAVTDEYSLTDSKFTKKDEEKMAKRATNIARLEEKIKILSKEDVPSDYVSKRAIKIRKAMMNNITYLCDGVYSIGIDKKDKVFDSTEELKEQVVVDDVDKEVQEKIAQDVRMIMDENNRDKSKDEVAPRYVPDAVTKEEIRAEIDSEFEDVLRNREHVEPVNEEVSGSEIDLEAIRTSIDDAFREQANENNHEVVTASAEDVEEHEVQEVPIDVKVSRDDIRNEIDAAMAQAVSRNGSSEAKLDRFNSDGSSRKKYDYVPMTDEEIKAAQENIEYEKYEEVYRMNNAYRFKTAEFKDIFRPATGVNKEIPVTNDVVREVPVVAPDIDGERFVTSERDMHEEQSRSENRANVVSRPTSLEEFSELKAKVAELKKKLAESENRKNAAVQFATRTADRAEEIKKITIASEKEYQGRLASLQLLARTLEENCNLNDTAARTATIDAECNERFISSQMDKKERYDDAINQVDSILGESVEEEHHHGRRAA